MVVEGWGSANGVKSHPKRMEMKKKFLPVQKLPRKLLGMLKWDSPTLLSANSLRRGFIFSFNSSPKRHFAKAQSGIKPSDMMTDGFTSCSHSIALYKMP